MNDTLSDLDRIPADPATAGTVATSDSATSTAAPDRALGIVALVLGIAGIVLQQWPLAAAAFVLGVLSLRREPQARGFAIAGLVLGALGTLGWLLLLQLGLAVALPIGLLSGALPFWF
ncbi:MAG: DUF4190 domain-containing protein [Actinomycetales bacterium]|nr:DUF4190 domain-containing protein [Actinomycetales bacterium]